MRISVTEAGVNNAKLGGVAGGECECGDDVGLVGFLCLPVEKEEAKLSAIEVPGEAVGSGRFNPGFGETEEVRFVAINQGRVERMK